MTNVILEIVLLYECNYDALHQIKYFFIELSNKEGYVFLITVLFVVHSFYV
jgi:hypothetical protein